MEWVGVGNLLRVAGPQSGARLCEAQHVSLLQPLRDFFRDSASVPLNPHPGRGVVLRIPDLHGERQIDLGSS